LGPIHQDETQVVIEWEGERPQEFIAKEKKGTLSYRIFLLGKKMGEERGGKRKGPHKDLANREKKERNVEGGGGPGYRGGVIGLSC